jgi:hypothetical protein
MCRWCAGGGGGEKFPLLLRRFADIIYTVRPDGMAPAMAQRRQIWQVALNEQQ